VCGWASRPRHEDADPLLAKAVDRICNGHVNGHANAGDRRPSIADPIGLIGGPSTGGLLPTHGGAFMKSQGDILTEAAVCDGIEIPAGIHRPRPARIHSHSLGSLVVVRLQGVLTPAERQLIAPRPEAACTDTPASSENDNGNSNGNGNGRSLLKQVRSHMLATGRPPLADIVETAVGVKLVSVHHDISTVTGEELIVFSLAEAPACRPEESAGGTAAEKACSS